MPLQVQSGSLLMKGDGSLMNDCCCGLSYALATRNAASDINAINSTPTGFWTDTIDANQVRTGGYMQNLSNDQESWTWDVDLAAGNYVMAVGFNTSDDRGIIEIFLNGVSLGTVDTYTAGPPANGYNDSETINVVVASSGVQTLELKGTGTKNAGSSNFNLLVEYIEFCTTYVQLNRTNFTTLNPAWTAAADPNQVTTGGYMFDVANDQSTAEWSFSMDAGTYDYRRQWNGNPGFGIADILLDGVSLGLLDFYNGAARYNMADWATVIVPASGVHLLTVAGNGTKNPASAGFSLIFELVQFSK